MSTTDWSAIRADYVTGQLSLQGLCDKWKVSFDNLKKKCQAEKWVRERAAYRQKIYNQSIAAKGKTAVSELVELNELDLIISKGLREIMRNKLDTMMENPEEASISDMATLARCHRDVQYVGRTATGADTNAVKDGLANKDKREYTTEELKQQLADIRREKGGLH